MEPNNLSVQPAPLEDGVNYQPLPQVEQKQPTKQRSWNWLWLCFTLILAVGFVVALVWLIKNKHNKGSDPTKTVTKIQNIDLNQIDNPAATLDASASDRVVINGLLQANKTILITPTAQPAASKLGLLYLDETTNQLRYYNGTSYVNLVSGTGVNYLSETEILNLIAGFGPPTILPQDLATTASPTFGGLSITNGASVGSLNVSGNTTTGSLLVSNNATIQGTLKIDNTTLINSAISDLSFTLPSADGAANQCLQTNGAGILSFAACASGVGTAFIQGGNSFGATAVLGTNDAFDLAFETNNSTKLTIQDATGYIGIGDTTPAALLTVGNGDLFQVSSAGAVTAVGVNSGAGLLQGALGLTITGAAVSLNNDSNFATNINTGTNNTLVSIGGGFGTFALDTTNIDISNAGAISNATGIAMTSGNFLQSGAGSLSTGTGAISLNGAVTGNSTYTFSGVATDITTGSNEDLTVLANGSGIISLNDTVAIGSIASADSDSYVVCRDVSSGQLSACDANTNGDPFIQNGNTFDATAVLGTNDAFDLQLETGGTTKLTIQNSTGNVGIGDTTPDAFLDIEPTGAVTSTSYAQQINNLQTNVTTDGINKYGLYISSTGSFTGSGGTATNNYGLYVATPTGGDNNYAAIFQGGNVGIGTALPDVTLQSNGKVRSTRFGSPTQYLEMNGGDISGIYLTASSTTAAAKPLYINNQVSDGAATTSTDIHLQIDGTTKFTLSNDGYVGIGDTTPLALLTVGDSDLFQVASNGNLTSTNAGTWTFNNDTNFVLSGDVNGLSFDTDTLSIDAFNNRVGIGTNSPLATLHVSSSGTDPLFRVTDSTATASDVLNIADGGAITLKNQTNSATAFLIQNTASAAVLTVDTTAQSSNLVTDPNSSFEGLVAGGNTSNWVAKGSSTLTVIDTQAKVGSQSLQIETTTAANDGATFTLNPGTLLSSNTAYTLSMYVKSASGTLTDVIIGFQNQSTDTTSCTAVQNIYATSWIQLTCSFTTGTTNSSSNVYIKKTGSVAETFYIDLVELYNTSGAKLTLGSSAIASQLKFMSAGASGGGSMTLQASPSVTANYALTLPAESGTICTDNPLSTCSITGDSKYLKKNTSDISTAAVADGSYLYTFNNNGTHTGGVLKLYQTSENTNSSVLYVRSDAVQNDNNLLLNLSNGTTSRFKIDVSGDITFGSNSVNPERLISMEGMTVNDTNGNDLKIIAATGNGTGDGGDIKIQGGMGGLDIGGSAQGGEVSINGGDSINGIYSGANIRVGGACNTIGCSLGSNGDGSILLTTSTSVTNLNGANSIRLKADQSIIMQSSTNNSTAFQVQKSNGTSLFTIDTSSGAITLAANTTVSANKSLTLSSGTGRYIQTYTGASQNAFVITAATLQGGRAMYIDATNTRDSDNNSQGVRLDYTNSQSGTPVSGSNLISGFDVQFAQSASVVGNEEVVANFVISGSSNLADTIVTAIINIANKDFNQIQAINGIKITGTGITNGINLAGSFGTDLITSNNFSVSAGGAIVGIGVSAGSGLLQGSGGLIVNGASGINAGSSNFGTNINTGSSTGLVTIGGGFGTFLLQTTNIGISSDGAITGATGITMASGNFLQSGTGTFGTGTGAISLNGNTTITGTKTLTVSGGLATLSAGLTSSGANIQLNVSSNYATNINTGTSIGAVSIGNTTAGETVLIQGGNGATAIQLQSASDGTISIGNNAVAQTLNIGNDTGATAISMLCGTGTCGFGGNATDHSTTIGSTTGTSATLIQGGTGFITLGTKTDINNTVSIGYDATTPPTPSSSIALNVKHTFTNTDSSSCSYGCYGLLTTATVDNPSNPNIATGGIFAVSTGASSFTLANAYGLQVGAGAKGAGSIITNNYGIQVAAQIKGDTNNYGVAVAAASTQTLWLSSNADNTTAPAGIAFGLSRDTNLYRSAADTLKTDSSLFITDRLRLGVDARTIADNGAGTNAALTLTPTSSYVEITCNDANGCDITMGEGSASQGDMLVIVNLSNITVNFADTAGVSELAGIYGSGQYDSINMVYTSNRWVELSRSNN